MKEKHTRVVYLRFRWTEVEIRSYRSYASGIKLKLDYRDLVKTSQRYMECLSIRYGSLAEA